jgi:hypothetical protein
VKAYGDGLLASVISSTRVISATVTPARLKRAVTSLLPGASHTQVVFPVFGSMKARSNRQGLPQEAPRTSAQVLRESLIPLQGIEMRNFAMTDSSMVCRQWAV